MSNVNAKIIYLPGADTNITVTRRNRVYMPIARRRPNMLLQNVAYMAIILAFLAGCFGLYAGLDWIVSLF